MYTRFGNLFLVSHDPNPGCDDLKLTKGIVIREERDSVRPSDVVIQRIKAGIYFQDQKDADLSRVSALR